MKTNIMKNSFGTRAGTSNDGVNFENSFIATLLLELTSNDVIIDFKLSSNDENFGKMDDVVVQIQLSNETQNYAFQLKHTSNKKWLKDKELTAPTGNFSIKSYCTSVSQIQNLDSQYKWILFTNLKFDPEKTNLKVKECEAHQVLKPVYWRKCVQFLEPEQENNSFLNAFFLYANGPSCDQLKKQGFKIFKDVFCGTRIMFEAFVNFITRWNNRKGIKDKLDKNFVRQIIANQLISPFIKSIPHLSSGIRTNEKSKLLRDAISFFRLTLSQTDEIIRIWDYLWDNFQERFELKQFRKKYQLAPDGINNISDEEFSLLVWLLDSCPLAVTYNSSVQKAIELCEEKKFILITNEEINGESIFKNLSDLSKSSVQYNNILNVFTCSLQRKEDITLRQLIQNDKEIEEKITTSHLLQMVDNSLLIGEEKERTDGLYLERFESQNIIDHTFLEKSSDDTFIVISRVINTADLEMYHGSVNFITDTPNGTLKLQDSCNEKKTICLLRTECSDKNFSDLCERNSDFLNYHHFRMTDNFKLEWIRSKGDITELKEFQEDGEFIPESQLYESMVKLNIICGPPGIGKTVLSNSLKNNVSPELWSILLNPKDYSKVLRDNNCEDCDLLGYILDNIAKKYTNTDLQLFKIFAASGRIFFIWDGVDELSQKNLDRLLRLILFLSEEGRKQCVTSRDTLKSLLETKLNVLSKRIRPFGANDLHAYIKTQTNSSDEIVSSILHNINSNIHFLRYSEVLRIPLHLYLFTELLRHNPQQYNALLKNILSLADLYEYFVEQQFGIFCDKKGSKNLNDFEHDSNEKFKNDRLGMYEKAAIQLFLSLDLDVKDFLLEIEASGDPVGIISQVRNRDTPVFLHNSYAEYFAAVYLSKHYKEVEDFAQFIFQRRHKNIRFLFDLLLAKNNECLAHLAVLNGNFQELKQLDTSVLAKKDKGGRSPLHIACSYGEQYPSLYVREVRHLRFKRYIIYDKTCATRKEDPQYANILNFLSENCNLDEEDEIFRYNPCMYADKSLCVYPLIVLLTRKKIDFGQLTNFKNAVTVMYYSIIADFPAIFDVMNSIPVIESQKMDGSILFLPAKYDSVNCLERLSKTKNYNSKFNKERNLKRLVNIACKSGSHQVLKFLVTNGGVKVESILHKPKNLSRAVEYGYHNFVKLLIEFEVDVNVVYKKMTPLHVACVKGNLEIVQLLVVNGADVDAVDAVKKRTPLHYACINGYLDIVQFLSENDAKIDIRDGDKITPIEYAFRNEHPQIVRTLSKKGAW